MQTNETQKNAYFSIHSVKALNKRQFSIVLANVDNTAEKLAIAKNLYPLEHWHIEFHNYKINVNFKVN